MDAASAAAQRAAVTDATEPSVGTMIFLMGIDISLPLLRGCDGERSKRRASGTMERSGAISAPYEATRADTGHSTRARLARWAASPTPTRRRWIAAGRESRHHPPHA